MRWPRDQFGNTLKKTKFVAKSCMKYDWLAGKGGGYAQLISLLKKAKKAKKKNMAVVFCMGVNDLQNIDLYISFYKSKYKELKNLGCDTYVMSVNPASYERRNPWTIDNFNKKLKSELKGYYKYLNLYSYLRKTGYCFLIKKGLPDGLHFTKATNGRIITKAIKMIG